MLEISTPGLTGRGLETGSRLPLNGHEAGNGGHSQGAPTGYRASPRPYQALLRVRTELRLVNESAVKSLDEGLEETLSLHRLGIFPQLGVSLKTTNWPESLNALVGQRTAKVDRWRTSEQKHRWLAAALLDIEPRLRRIKGFRALPLLRSALQAECRGQVPRSDSQAA